MTVTTTPAVQALMERALSQTSPTALLRLAADMTRPKSPWKGSRKLSHDQALAATRLVTEMLHRFDLKPTRVLVSGGRASERGATSRFYLSRREMEPGAVVSKRLASGIGAYVDNVKAIARHAREAGQTVEDDALLDELAAVLDGYLDQFRGIPEADANAELAKDVALVAQWLTHPARGFELARYLTGARAQYLDFRPETGTMAFLGPDACDFAFGLTPQVPLLTRIVAWSEAEILSRVEEPLAVAEAYDGEAFLFAPPRMEPLGRSLCVLCEKVGIGVSVEQGRLRMMFTLAPVTYAGVPLGGPNDPDWRTKGTGEELEHRGIPVPGRPEMTVDGQHWIDVRWPERFGCADFEAYFSSLFDEGGPDEATLVTERHLPVTAETCERFLSDGEWGDFEVARTFLGLTWDTVLPNASLDEAGVESRMVRDRFAELLYADGERSLAGLLHVEALKRTEAYEAFLRLSTTGDRRRKESFRARMRQ